MKTCSNCHESKELSEFHNSSKYADGVQLWCKACANIHGAYRIRKVNAKKQGDVFNVTFKQYYDLRKNTPFCPITKEPFRLQGSGGGHDSATLDKINPKLGYVIGNIAFISRKANTIKYTISTSAEARIIFANIIKYLEEHNV